MSRIRKATIAERNARRGGRTLGSRYRRVCAVESSRGHGDEIRRKFCRRVALSAVSRGDCWGSGNNACPGFFGFFLSLKKTPVRLVSMNPSLPTPFTLLHAHQFSRLHIKLFLFIKRPLVKPAPAHRLASGRRLALALPKLPQVRRLICHVGAHGGSSGGACGQRWAKCKACGNLARPLLRALV